MSVLNTERSLEGKAISLEEEKKRLMMLLDKWQESPLAKAVDDMARNSVVKGGHNKEMVKYSSDFMTQFIYLLGRASKNAIRNKYIVKVKLGQSLFISLLIGLIYRDIEGSGIPAQIIQV